MSWDTNFDHDPIWFHDILRKFSTAPYRNEFRRFESPYWREILSSTKAVLGMSLTSVESLSHAKRSHCMHSKEGSSMSESEWERDLLAPVSINVEFNNATLSLWLQRSQPAWTPFNTFTELSGSALAEHNSDAAATVTHWDHVIEKLSTLTASTQNTNAIVDLILSGDAWTVEYVAALEDRLKAPKPAKTFSVKTVILQPDVFASSKRSAEKGNLPRRVLFGTFGV